MTQPQPEKQEDFDDLFVDRNLFAVFKASPTIFATRFNWITSAFCFAALTAFSVVRFVHRHQTSSPGFVSTFATWANVGWTLSATLLGFLVAGFALLCTVLRPSAVIALHNYYEEGDDKNALRHLFLSFVDIFITYLSLLVFSLGMVIVTSTNGPALEIKDVFLRLHPLAPAICGYVVFVTWGTWYVMATLKLKTFVYNLYQALMIGMTESVHSTTECANMVTDQQPILSRQDRSLPNISAIEPGTKLR